MPPALQPKSPSHGPGRQRQRQERARAGGVTQPPTEITGQVPTRPRRTDERLLASPA